MKLIPLLALTLATGAAIAPNSAHAGRSEAAAAIGGFIGGVIVGAHLDHHHDHGRREHRRYEHHHHPSPRVVVIERDHRPRGYWSERTVKVWVPSRWVWTVDDCGRRVRHRERGHYEYRRERVWVDGHRHH